MSGALLAGIFAGYAIAVPVGVIAVLIIETGMSGGLRRGLAAGAGAATVDLVYCAGALGAGGLLSQALALFLVPLQVLSGIVLIAIGLRGLGALWTHRGTPIANLDDPRVRGSARQLYLRFILLTALSVLPLHRQRSSRRCPRRRPGSSRFSLKQYKMVFLWFILEFLKTLIGLTL